MEITVAIVTHERPERLEALLASLRRQSRVPEELLVVNNGSDDRTTEIVDELREAFDRLGVRLWRINREDGNLPAGRNAAVEATNGEVICFLDDDTVASKRWLAGIEAGYKLNENVAAVGGPSIAVDENLSSRNPPIRREGNQNHLNRYGESEDLSSRWIPPRPVQTDRLQGSNMSFRRDSLEAIGGFDPGYCGYPLFEDTDVMAKLWRRNERVIYHPRALVYHLRVARGETERYWYWFGYNSIRYRRENFPETYRRSLVRLLIWTTYFPPAVWKQLGALVLYGETRYRWLIAGYCDGLLGSDRFRP